MSDEYANSESVFIFTTTGFPQAIYHHVILDMVTVKSDKSVESVISGDLFVMFLNIYLLT